MKPIFLKKTIIALGLAFFSFFEGAIAQTSYSNCYYLYANVAQELYKNGELGQASRYFERAAAEAKTLHRTDLIAYAACYAKRDSSKKAIELLHLAIDKGRRFDWFENVYYFDKLKTDTTAWNALARYIPITRQTTRALNYHGLLDGLQQRLENGENGIETVYAFRDLIQKYGLPAEGELDDNDAKNLQLLGIEAAEMPKTDYLAFVGVIKDLVKNGVLRAKDYSIIIDYGIMIRASHAHEKGELELKGEQPPLTFGDFEHFKLSTLSPEGFAAMNARRKSIGLLPFGFDISAESLAKINCTEK